MKTTWSTNVLLGIIAALLAMILIQRVGTDSKVYAQSGAKFGYLQTAASPGGPGALVRVVDLRNGNVWNCRPGQSCQFEGRIPLEQLDTPPRR